jgi:hypothetical protein
MTVLDGDTVVLQYHPFGFNRDYPAGMNQYVGVFHPAKINESPSRPQVDHSCVWWA